MNGHSVILVPVDFSPIHPHVLAFADKQACQSGASLLLLHVVQYRDPMRQRPPEILMAPLEDCAKAITSIPEGRVSTLAVEGDPIQKILETAELYRCKTIVMGYGVKPTVPGHVARGVKKDFRGLVHWVSIPLVENAAPAKEAQPAI